VTVFHDLLRVQEHDTGLDRLHHRRTTLPELAALSGCEDELARVEARGERRLESELAAVASKIIELDAKLYSGVVTAPRELQAMQTEGGALRERRSALEDEVLEVMGTRESLDEQVVELSQKRVELDGEGMRLRVAVAEAQAEIDRALMAEAVAREEAVAAVPAEVAALYEQLRVRLGGVAAAPLVNGRCGGCHLALPATEVSRLRKEPAETLVRCEQCECILVRP